MDNNNILNRSELIKYACHISLRSFGIENQEKLKRARVLCVGAGGLGAPILLYLAAAGIGRIGIVDHDTVSESNLQRQVIYKESDVGHSKVDKARNVLLSLNSTIEVDVYKDKITEENAFEIIEKYEYVIDATDNFQCRYVVSDACFYLNKPYFYSSIFEFEGLYSHFYDYEHSPCYRCFNPKSPPKILAPNCSEAGVIGALPGMIGTFVAMEVIKAITGLGQVHGSQLVIFNVLNNSLDKFTLKKNSECILCQKKTPYFRLPNHVGENQCSVSINVSNEISAQDLSLQLANPNNIKLVDVRNDFEHEVDNIGGISLPVKILLEQAQLKLKKNDHIIMYCKSGKRSAAAIKILKEKGYTNVKSLHGGLLEWKKYVDATIKVI